MPKLLYFCIFYAKLMQDFVVLHARQIRAKCKLFNGGDIFAKSINKINVKTTQPNRYMGTDQR